MNQQDYIKALREAADWFEAHPMRDGTHFCLSDFSFFVPNKDALAEVARMMGHAKKVMSDDCMFLETKIAGVTLRAFIYRSLVCKRVVKKTTLAPEPELIIAAKPAREVEIVEWECDEPILATPSPVEVGANA